MTSLISSLVSSVAPHLPSQEQIQNQIQELLPYLTVFALGLLLLGILGRVFLGKRSAANHSVSSAMAVLFIYIVSISIYTFRPLNLEQYISPLPMVTMAGDTLVLFPFHGTSLHMICTQILPLLILSFLVNLLDDFIPQGKTIPGWFVLRFLTVGLAMILHLVLMGAFNKFLPNVLVQYAPMILLGVLVVLLCLGLLNVLLGLVLAVVNPILGGIYAFFFSNMIGKEITKSVFTTVLLCVFFFVLESLGFVALDISQSSLITYLPFTCLTMVLWYLLGHTL